ncbi:MAG TPA: hypothetical protein VKM54_12585, partial [Myxococcota bacterium]|nr:hypothetical protein [Myxococcota bacterium]
MDPDTWQQAQEELRMRASRFGRARDGSFRGSARGHRVRAKHLLSGFLECEICGGGFFRAWSNRFLRLRLASRPGACSNDLRIAQQELETRFLRGVQKQILVPDLVLYAVEKALDLAHVRAAEPRTSADRARLAEVETEIEHLVRLAARLGHLDASERVLGELERERDQLRARLRQSTPEFDLEALRTRSTRRSATSGRGLWGQRSREGRRCGPSSVSDVSGSGLTPSGASG